MAARLLAVDPNWREEPLAHLIMRAEDGANIVPIFDQLFVGRVCAGIAEHRRLVIDDPVMSRNHAEISLSSESNVGFPPLQIENTTNSTSGNHYPGMDEPVQRPDSGSYEASGLVTRVFEDSHPN